jgi:hypothetical protein
VLWNASVNDSVPPALIKYCKSNLHHPLHYVIFQLWREGLYPQDMRDAEHITVYKNKGDGSKRQY